LNQILLKTEFESTSEFFIPIPPSTAAFTQSNRLSESNVGVGWVFFSGARPWPCLVLATASLLGFLNPQITIIIAPWPFLLALALFGMPHGAADWSIESKLMHRRGFIARLFGFKNYLLWMLACTLLIALAPGFAILGFLLLTVFHFGMADANAVGADEDGFVARWALVISRGLLLLSTAFALHAQEAWRPFSQIAQAISLWPQSSWMPNIVYLAQLATIGMVFGGLLAFFGCVARMMRGHWREAIQDMCEHSLVVVLAVFSDPLFAIGCFFIGVHAFRHTRRLAQTRIILEPPACHPNFWARVIHVHFLSLPLLLPTAACLLPLCWMLGSFDARTIAVSSIAFYMITTLPHHLLGLKLPAVDLR